MNISRKVFIFACLFGFQALLPAQVLTEPLVEVQGVVLDNETPVEFMNVSIYSFADSTKLIKTLSADSLGKFYFSNLKPGNYFIKFQLIGYLERRISFELDSSASKKELGNLQVKPDSKLLESIEVFAHKDLIKKTPQGFIINAADNLTQTGGTATDLLKNTPTVVVDGENGGITIRGKSPLILINGRNSNLSATDRIPASSIESIEIINNPSAQYDADAEGGIINIKLKKNSLHGTNGAATLGAGYGAHGRVNSSFMINHQTGKWNFGLAYDNRFALRTRGVTANRTNFDIPSNYYLIQNRHDNRLEQSQNMKLNIDFNPNEKNSLSFEAIANYTGQDNDETLFTLSKSKTDSFVSNNSRRSIELGREKVGELALNYNRKFSDERKYLTANLSSSFNYETENTNITTQGLFADNSNFGNAYLQRTNNYQTSNVSNLKIDYGLPIAKRGLFEIGYKGITRYMNADFKSQYLLNTEYVNNPLVSNVFNFQEQIHAAYIQYKGYTGKQDSCKLRYDIGLRAEQVYNEGKGLTNNVFVKREYFNLFPSANLAYYLNTSDFIKLSFSRRINRPGLGQLNPFVDITDSLNPHGGNPYLKPEMVNALEGGYNKEWKKVSMSSNVFYRYATNIIRNYIILKNNGVALTLPGNFGNSTTYGLEEIISLYPTKFYSSNLSLSFFQQDIDGGNVSPEFSSSVFSWNGKMINNFNLWKGSKLQVILNYNSPIGTPQGQKIAIYYADFGFQQKVLKGKGGLGVVVTDAFNTQINGYTATTSSFYYSRKSKIDTRAILISFAYSFGSSFKEEMIENKFSND